MLDLLSRSTARSRAGNEPTPCTVSRVHGGDQRVALGSNMNPRVSPLCRFTADGLLVLVDEFVAFPMGITANFARTTGIVEAGKESIRLGPRVPPNHHQSVQLTGRAIRVDLVHQCRSSSSQVNMRPAASLASIREKFAALHVFRGIPIARQCSGEPCHFWVGRACFRHSRRTLSARGREKIERCKQAAERKN